MIRTFLGWERPILHAAADALMNEAGEGGPVELTGVLVALPGGRAGRRFVELLLERSDQAGRPLRPPRVTTVGDLPEELYRPALPEPGPALDRRAWARALQMLDPAELKALVPTAPEGPDDPGWSSLAGTLGVLQREVGAAGLDFREVAAACHRHLLFCDEERWRVLALAQERYRELLLRHGYRDREASRREARSAPPDVSAASFEEVWIVGAPDLPPVTRTFIEAAARRVRLRILVGAPQSLAARFDSLGCVVPGAWADELAGLPESAVRVVSDPASQAEAAILKLAELEGRHSAEEVTLGVPDREVVPYLVERLSEAGIPVRDAGGLELERTPIFRLLEATARYLESRHFDAFAALIRHPDFEKRLRLHLPALGISIPALADRYQSRYLQSRVDGGWLPPGGEEADRVPEPGRAMRALRDAVLTVLSPFGESTEGGRARGPDAPRPLAAWIPAVRSFLVDLYGGAPLHRHREGDRELLEAARRIGAVLEELEALPRELDPPIPAHRALHSLLDELRGASIPPEGEEGAVELLGWLELALDDAPVLIVSGANEPHLPESVTADPFLPHGLRQVLGLLDNAGRWARDLLHLKTILATRPHVLVVAGRRDVEGNPLRLSRLLLAEDRETVARRILRFLEVESTGGEAAAPGAAGEQEGAPWALPPEPFLVAPGPPDRIRVTAFRELLADPYRYALERVLDLAHEDDRAREMDGPAFGSLAHAVLEGFGRSPEAHSANPGRIVRALDELLDELVRARFGTRSLPAVRLQAEQLRLRLRAFAEWQALRMGEGWRIRAVEVSPAGEGAAFLVDERPILLRGTVDRVDRHEGTGEWAILDYKTGDRVATPEAAHRSGRESAKRWKDLQLPLYLRLAPTLRDGEEPVGIPSGTRSGIGVGVGYVALPCDPGGVGAMMADWSESELEEAEEVARDVVRTLRENRFVYAGASSAIRSGDPLAAVVGGGVLRLEDEEERDD